MDCIFCKIISGEIPSYTIFEDKIVKVFLNIDPSSDGDMLVIPKTHFENILDIDLDVLCHINVICKQMYAMLKEKLNVDGLTITQNNDYGRHIEHFHVHLTPRYKKDNVKIIYPNKKSDIKDVYKKLTEK